MTRGSLKRLAVLAIASLRAQWERYDVQKGAALCCRGAYSPAYRASGHSRPSHCPRVPAFLATQSVTTLAPHARSGHAHLHHRSGYQFTWRPYSDDQLDRHQGQIEVQSRQGEGTVFTIHLPLRQTG